MVPNRSSSGRGFVIRGPSITVVVTVIAASFTGAAIASGQAAPALAVELGAVAMLAAPRVLRIERLPLHVFAIEVPIILLLLSTLVFRIRTADALTSNPLDAAGLYRVGCIVLAALLSWAAYLRNPQDPIRKTPPAVWFFVGYVVVVFVATLESVKPVIAGYRGVELGVGLFAVVTAIRTGGARAVVRLEQIIYGYLLVLIATVWIGVVVAPSRAVTPSSPIPFAIQGVLPQVASNGVGYVAALLCLWSVGRRVAGISRRPRIDIFVSVVGLITLVAAQYRTGYLATAVAGVALLLARGRRTLAAALAVGAIIAAFWNFSTLTSKVQPYALRGQSTQQASELSGRLTYWSHAIPVWERSPVIGRGLSTGTRFEVLAPLGDTTTSTIHSTWIEALVGTGVAGVTLLGIMLSILLLHAVGDLFSRRSLVYPGLIIVFIAVTSITGTSFELFSFNTLVVLALAYRLDKRWHSATAHSVSLAVGANESD